MTALTWVGLIIAIALLIYSLRGASQAGAVRMTTNGWLQLGLILVVLLGLAKPLGTSWRRVYEAKRRGSAGSWGRSNGCVTG
jgi:uncharacterized membrane protein